MKGGKLFARKRHSSLIACRREELIAEGLPPLEARALLSHKPDGIDSLAPWFENRDDLAGLNDVPR